MKYETEFICDVANVMDSPSLLAAGAPSKAKSQSWWQPAQLDNIKEFLQAERDAGRFLPVFSEGLD